MGITCFGPTCIYRRRLNIEPLTTDSKQADDCLRRVMWITNVRCL